MVNSKIKISLSKKGRERERERESEGKERWGREGGRGGGEDKKVRVLGRILEILHREFYRAEQLRSCIPRSLL